MNFLTRRKCFCSDSFPLVALSLILCGILPVLAESSGDNLVKNPSFEDIRDECPTGWNTARSGESGESGNRMATTSEAHAGKSAVLVTLKNSDDNVTLNSTRFKVTPGRSYHIEFWLKKEGGFRAIPLFFFFSGKDPQGHPEIKKFPVQERVKEYEHFVDDIECPADCAGREGCLQIYMDWFQNKKEGKKQLWLDEVSITETSATKVNP